MKLLCLVSIFIMSLFAESIGFNYAPNPPKEIFSIYDTVIVEPTGISNIKQLKKTSHAKIYAYVSIGEKITPPNKNWIIGKNKKWNSYIMDIRNPKYQQFLLNRLKELQNYDGFMFDTIDSYQMVLDKSQQKEYEKELILFIKKAHKKFPTKKIIINRGFEILDKIKNDINSVLAENLFTTNNNGNIYPQSKDGFKWLLNKLNYAKNLGLNVIVIDYSKHPQKEIKLAKKIINLGFIPFISNLNLTDIGLSTTKLEPRKILIIHNTPKKLIFASDAHMLYSMPLEHLGYLPRLVEYKNLPKGYLADKYAGIIIALENPIENKEKFFKWIKKNMDDGLKIVFMRNIPFDKNILKNFNLNSIEPKSLNYTLYYQDKNISDYEINPTMDELKDNSIIYMKHSNIINSKNHKIIISFKNDKNQIFDTCAYTKWGAYCLNPVLDFNKDTILWIINPFKFFRKALNLKNIPLPDNTTENGRRIAISHIDGDGFMEKNYVLHKFASEVLYEKLFTKTTFPISASIIEAEIAPYGLYPQYSKKLIKIAKKIYKLKNIEPASHAFSHPFKWDSKNPDRLPVKNYTHFSPKREILGSIKFIKKLVPKNKKVNLFFWTGDCLPNQEDLKICKTHHILNINGGDTTITQEHKFISLIMPIGIWIGKYFQVYAPITNENIYTNLWKDKGGYVKVIQTFKLTNKPRTKPIDIYYHFYSGSTTESLGALLEVYKWVKQQKITPMFTSEYIKIAHDFENTVVAKSIINNSYIIRNKGNLRTLKLEGKYNIDIKNSKNVLGYNFYDGWTYIHLTSSGNYKVKLGSPKMSYLISSNGRIFNYKRLKNGYSYILKSYLPIKIKFKKLQNCKTIIKKQKFKAFIKVECE